MRVIELLFLLELMSAIALLLTLDGPFATDARIALVAFSVTLGVVLGRRER